MPGRYRQLVAGTAAAPVVLLAAACGATATSASEPVSTVSAAPTSSASVAAATTPATTPAASAAASVTAGGTATAAPTGCTAQAAHTYYHVLSWKQSATGGVLLTGHIAAMICGGPDDWHFEDATASVPASVLPSAHVEVIAMTGGIAATTIPVSQLISALSRDQSTRTFLVQGPLTAITSLSEIFHP
jgi:hypothetical protein